MRRTSVTEFLSGCPPVSGVDGESVSEAVLMSAARFLGLGVAATLILSLGAGGAVRPPQPGFLVRVPLVQPRPPQPLGDLNTAPGKDRTGLPPRTGAGLPGTANGPSAKERQQALADQALKNPAPRPPMEPGVDQETIDKIRDEAEKSVPDVVGINGTPEDGQG
jgi:hypothetical protein